MREDAKDRHLRKMIEEISREGKYRLLRRLQLETGRTALGSRDAPFIGVVVDVETTGVDPTNDAIIELALRRFRYDHDGTIVAIDRSYSWLEDPARPLSPEIVKLTGLTDADLEGKLIDEDAAVTLLGSGTLCIAHNAAFDRKFVDRRLPRAADLAWACSCTEIDWRAHGFDGRSLGWLLSQAGWFHDGHRAGEDVDGVIALLGHRFDNGRTALSVLHERAMQPSWIVRARGAAYAMKEQLRLRGYRWDPDWKAWWREVADVDRLKEEFWLAGNVYCAQANPKALGPHWEEVTRFERYR